MLADANITKVFDRAIELCSKFSPNIVGQISWTMLDSIEHRLGKGKKLWKWTEWDFFPWAVSNYIIPYNGLKSFNNPIFIYSE
jgi:hypothetical protein